MLQLSNELHIAIQNNKSLSHQLEDIESKLNSKNTEMTILTEKNSIVNNLIIQQEEQYKELLSQYEKLQLHQKYIPSTPTIDHHQDNMIKHLESINLTLKQEIESLKHENIKLSERYHQSEEQNMLLQSQLHTSHQLVEELQESVVANAEELQLMKHTSHEVIDQLNEKNQQIDHLKEKLAINHKNDSFHSTSYNPITSNMKQTMRMDDLSHFKTSPLLSGKDGNHHHLVDRTNVSGHSAHHYLILAGEKHTDRDSRDSRDRHEPSYFHVSELNDTGHTFYLDVVDETMHSAPMSDNGDIDTMTTIRSRPTSTRFTSERQHSQIRDLQCLIYEYETKEKDWDQEKEDLNMSLIDKCMEIDRMKKELEEEKETHAKEMENMLKIYNPDDTLPGHILQHGKNEWVKIVSEEDESSPISGEEHCVNDKFFNKDHTDQSSQTSSDDPPGCVCFTFRLW